VRLSASWFWTPDLEVDPVNVMSDALRFTIRYSDGGEGWVMAQVEQVPGAISQGRTRKEARENVIDALRLMPEPEPEPDHTVDPDREPLDLPLAS
jgi:predicted RNase H-like HicB family nuclease